MCADGEMEDTLRCLTRARQRAGAERFGFVSHWNFNIIGSSGLVLSAPVADLDGPAQVYAP